MDSYWNEFINREAKKEYFIKLNKFLDEKYKNQIVVFPKKENIFRAFELTPFKDIKVVIIGQDPYINEGQAQGLSFSVNDGIKLPPSLKNIFKEIALEYDDFLIPTSGNLESWAEQGVFLLNNILTVDAGCSLSHAHQGWEEFTRNVVFEINKELKNVVYMFWGKQAASNKDLIDANNNLILEAPHPSPLSAHRGFFGCNHFRKCNDYLVLNHKAPIEW